MIEHHPHILQGMEIYKNRNILYSLGNFSFGGSRNLKSDLLPTVIAAVNFEFDENKQYLSQQLTLWPCYTNSGNAFNNYQPYLVSGDTAQEVISIMQKDTACKLAPYQENLGAVQERLTR